MRQEKGYILLTVMVIVFVITLATIMISGHTLDASFFAVRRSETVRAFSLAESAAMEGFWKLTVHPDFRGTQERHWGAEWYRYEIIDNSTGTNDYTLEILGRGYVQGSGNQRAAAVRLHLKRAQTTDPFQIESETEDKI